MSPTSAGPFQVEQYIGACLISQNRPKNIKSRADFYTSNPHNNVYQGNPYGNAYPHDGWAGGVPLISYANHQRRGSTNRRDLEEQNNNLSRLAVHTQGAPLIVTKSYQHRKNKPQRTDGVQQTKIFENSNNKKHNNLLPTKFDVIESNNAKNVDTISVTSDESSGSQNSVEMCLPRIIKPRKRRKKDRKPGHLRSTQSQQINDFDYNNVNEPCLDSPTIQHFSAFNSNHNMPNIDYFNSNLVDNINRFHFSNKVLNNIDKKVPENVINTANTIFEILNTDISETPKLHHNFEDVKEELNCNQTSINCQCRYCEPSGKNIWDVDRSCYSPFLTPPKVFDFGNLEAVLSQISSNIDGENLYNNSINDFDKFIEKPTRKTSFSRSWSSFSGSSDLEVSTEIVTSLNGHRDLEIKFFNPSAVAVENRNNNNKSTVKSESLTSKSGTIENKKIDAIGENLVLSSFLTDTKESGVTTPRCDHDGLSEQNTSFFSNGTIVF